MDRAAHKRRVLAKLGEVCARIEKHLAGQNVTLADVKLPQVQTPGKTPLERLQRFKGLLNETLAELNRGEARACQRCQEPLGAAVLDEMPWAFACPPCASS